MPINHTQSRLRDGHSVFGCIFQQFRSAEIPRLLAAAGFDFVFIDCEHGGFDLETIQDVVRVSRLAGITPLVRVGELSYSLAARALDVGAQGIILPRVEEPELLREALSWMKFPPVGKRGFGLGPPQLDYRTQSFAETIADANASTLTVVQFESVKALEQSGRVAGSPGRGCGADWPVGLVDLAWRARGIRAPEAGRGGLLVHQGMQPAWRGSWNSGAQRSVGKDLGRARNALRRLWE